MLGAKMLFWGLSISLGELRGDGASCLRTSRFASGGYALRNWEPTTASSLGWLRWKGRSQSGLQLSVFSWSLCSKDFDQRGMSASGRKRTSGTYGLSDLATPAMVPVAGFSV